ncbi:hypothetical protein KV205_11310 [Streptomyces sp. SKN60]|uniref:hypothetical protein n=1 Tax=Streptomyces sp. SKN60 TaxID=2855506 RepID=UPI00224841C4|nr:hypothetical protein [Streptomyces sp. SKN60]MCX2181115.1 hypothetical protein [Streptomyces sp. SKN60]
MHLFATIPQPDGSKYTDTFTPLLRALFAPARTSGHGPYYFVRTWDGATGSETLQISIDELPDPARTRDDLLELANRQGCEARVEIRPRDTAPSPLWNAGFAGSGFTESSQRLFQRAAPTLIGLLERSAEGGDQLSAALDVLRLMATHSRATLLNSPQRGLDGYEFRDLLALRLLSYRSHFEAVYLRTKNPESFEAACARFYEQAGPAVRDFIRACGDPTGDVTGDPGERTPLRQWTELVTTESGHLADRFLSGALVNAGETLADLERRRGGPVEPTRFHTPPIPELDRLMHRDADFLAFRLLTSLLYSSLHTLGLSLAERYVYCYVVARASEEVAGRSVKELQDELDGLAKAMAAVPSAAVE